MTEHHEGHQSGYQRLQAQKSLKEILEIATEFERIAHDFYTALVPKVSKQIRYLVEELAAEEQEHFDLFQKLANNPDLEKQVGTLIDTPANDHGFSDCIHLPDLGDHPDDQAVLQYALYREHAAMEQYSALADSTEPGPVQELFRYLAQEETKHKNELEKAYYETVHRGGV
ncbi:MAG: ferritin family protein [Gammaproteobacteria bacterium]|nr:ferritin family protein [Gammaproteobacteria bacterium]